MPEQATAIAALNDQFRRSLDGGQVVITRGISELGSTAVGDLLVEVTTFQRFTEESDPHGEHDFGVVRYDGQKVFWKIDYYDPSLTFHSEDAADPAKTLRVLTIMLASEY
jgi:uncharacterized protein DUF3768